MADNETTEMASAARRYWAEEGWTPGGVLREVDYSSQSGGLSPALQGIKIVDCDTHITEAPDLFTARAVGKFKDRMPQVRQVGGTDRWFVGDRNFGTLGGNVIRTDNHKLLGIPAGTSSSRGCRRWTTWASTRRSAITTPA